MNKETKTMPNTYTAPHTSEIADALIDAAHDADTGVIWTGPAGETIEAFDADRDSWGFDAIDENGTVCLTRYVCRTSWGWATACRAQAEALADSLT